MLVQVSRDVLLDARFDAAVVDLFDKCFRAVVPEDEESFGSMLNRRPTDRQRILAAVERSRLRLQHVKALNMLKVVRTPTGRSEISIQEALTLSRVRYSLLLENDTTDRNFLLWILPRQLRDRILRLENDQMLVLDHRGGCDEIRKALDHDKYHLSINIGMCGALVDSDGVHQGCRSTAIDQVETQARAKNIDLHVLPRRTIENFIDPDDVQSLAARIKGGELINGEFGADVEAIATEFANLPAELRKFVHVKEGFKKDKSVFKHVREKRSPPQFVGFNLSQFEAIWPPKEQLQRDYPITWQGFASGITCVFQLERSVRREETSDVADLIGFMRLVVDKAQ